MKKKSLSLVSKVCPIFLDIVKIGIEDLIKDCMDVDDRMKEALDIAVIYIIILNGLPDTLEMFMSNFGG